MVHEILIILHAGSAVLCLAFGALTLLPGASRDSQERLSGYYLVTLIAMIVFLAGAILLSQGTTWFPRYVDHIGFTLIALFEGFIIVGGIDAGAPAWLTTAAAVLGVLAGNRTLHRLQAQGNSPAR